MNDPRKDQPDSKTSPRTKHSSQLQTHNVPTEDVENPNSTNKDGDLLFVYKPRIVPRGTKNAAKEGEKQIYCTLINAPSRGAKRKEKSSYGMD